MPLRFVAIVDGDNQPVYFQSAPDTPSEVALNQQFIAEMSLDFIEQQLLQLQAQLHLPQLVVIHDGVAVYALLTNTRDKYLVGLDSRSEVENIDEIVREVALVYTGYQCNPFGTKKGLIKSTKFDEQIKKIILKV